jgi:hypothetical protein
MVTGLGKAVAGVSLETWKDYLTFHLIDHYSATSCPRPSSTSASPSTARRLQGTPQLSPRWKRAVGSTNAVLGEAVGKLYADKYFSAQAKAEVTAMVDNMKVAFENRIDGLDLDGPDHQGRGPQEGGGAEGRRRLSRPVARLFRLRRRARRRVSATCSARKPSTTRPLSPSWASRSIAASG